MKWEDSKADEMADRKNAQKAGMSVSKWEGSPGDKKKDAEAKRKKVEMGAMRRGVEERKEGRERKEDRKADATVARMMKKKKVR